MHVRITLLQLHNKPAIIGLDFEEPIRDLPVMPDAPIQITRYPNRRFYTRSESRYVSLEEIEQMVRDGKQVEIRDSQTDEDLTRPVLTRIIMDRQPRKMRLVPIKRPH